ncbi:reverse transcriptase domain-containing protein [Tanacetum coccineum]
MTTPRLIPFPATSLLARVFTSFVTISDSNNEITTLPVRPAPPSPDCTLALYGYPLDSGDDSSDENLSETAKSLHTHTTSTSVVHPLQTRPLPTSLAYCLSTGKRDLDATRLQSSHGSMENCITIHLDDIETLRASLAFVMQETMTPRARVGSLEQHDVVTRESVRITIGRLEMAELQSRAQDIEASFWDLKRHLGDHGGISGQQRSKEHKVIKVHITEPRNKKGYAGNLPLCNKCKFHHTGPCTAKYGNCKRVGHQTRDCRTPVLRVKQRPLVAKQKAKDICYECGRLGHYKNSCLERKNQNQVNKQWKAKNLWRL